MDSVTDIAPLLDVLRCPLSGQKLRNDGARLVAEDGKISYRIENGIPVLLADEAIQADR